MSLDQPHTPTPLATVFIVDDEESVRKSLLRFLKSHGYKAIALASAADFLKGLPYDGYGCLILDLQMPNMSGIELQQKLAESGCELPIVFLTAQGDIPTSVKAMKQGAEDFLPKMADEKELLDAVQRALHCSAQTIERRQQTQQAHASAASLTDRECQVCRYVISGMLNKQIAAKLGITERTVKAHRAQVMQKFGVQSIAELVRMAECAGIEKMED